MIIYLFTRIISARHENSSHYLYDTDTTYILISDSNNPELVYIYDYVDGKIKSCIKRNVRISYILPITLHYINPTTGGMNTISKCIGDRLLEIIFDEL